MILIATPFPVSSAMVIAGRRLTYRIAKWNVFTALSVPQGRDGGEVGRLDPPPWPWAPSNSRGELGPRGYLEGIQNRLLLIAVRGYCLWKLRMDQTLPSTTLILRYSRLTPHCCFQTPRLNVNEYRPPSHCITERHKLYGAPILL